MKQDYEPVPIPPSCLPTSTNSSTGDHSESSNLGFSVRRTVNGALPVYTDYKNGRSRITTIVRRVDGDITALAGMLSEIFPAAAVDLRRRQEMTAVGAGGVQMHMASGSETTTTMDATDATPTTLLRRPSANALRPRVTLRADLGQVHIRGNVQRTVRHWLTALGF